MKTYGEIGLDFIRPENKEGNDTIKEVLYEVNDYIFNIKGRPISPCNCQRYYELFYKAAIRLAAETPTERAEAKWKEVGKKIKDYCNILKHYTKYELSEEDGKDIQRLVNYQLHLYLSAKEKELTPTTVIKLLNNWKEIKEDYIDCCPYPLKTDKFIIIKKELFEYLEKYYN